MSDRTDGRRIYAIGDVHGCRHLLDDMVDRIHADLAARPHAAPLVVFLGDYVDRGPDTRGVIARLISMAGSDLPARFLLGNHDACALAFLADPLQAERNVYWLEPNMGGAATLASYEVADASPYDARASHAAFVRAFPDEHRTFLEDCELMVRVGDYLFAHAGIRPGVPLEKQRADDLIWIREPFLTSTRDFGVKVVHGHTIVPEVQHHPNRIAVDTGAVVTGLLSCVVLEGEDVALLTPDGPDPLPVAGPSRFSVRSFFGRA